VPSAITFALPSALYCRGQALESGILGNSHVPFGEGPTEKGWLCSTSPAAYSTLGYPFENRAGNSTVSNRLVLCLQDHASEKRTG